MKNVLTIAGLFLCFIGYGQNNYLYINWDVNKPLSNTDWLNSTSSNGAKVGYRGFFGEDRTISFGLDLNSTTYEQYEPTETFINESGALTTDYFKYVYSYGVTVSAQYYFPLKDNQKFFPYAGLGLGANHNEYTLYYNIYSEGDRAWGFLARPEAGILFRFNENRSLGLMAAVHYDYSTNKIEAYNYNNFSSFGFQLGIILMNRY